MARASVSLQRMYDELEGYLCSRLQCNARHISLLYIRVIDRYISEPLRVPVMGMNNESVACNLRH